MPAAHGKCAGDVAAAPGGGEACLYRGRAFAPQGVPYWNAAFPRDQPRQKLGLVKAAAPAFAPMQGHGYDGVVVLVDWKSAREKYRERPRQRFHPRVLEQVNQAAERAFVRPETRSMIEAPEACPASRTDARIVERERIQKRGIADGAEEFGVQRLWRTETGFANGDTRPFGERVAAETAIIRINQRKNCVGNPADEI